MTELPLLVIDVQRGGPSTGLPTKTEQADLLQALYGRNGESPVAVLAPRSPADCFETALEAVRIAVSYHTPVILLSDGAIANGSEPWRIPDVNALPPIKHTFAKPGEPFQPYARDRETLARQFAIPGTPVWNTASAGWKLPMARATSPTSRLIMTSWSGCAKPRSTVSMFPIWKSMIRPGTPSCC